MSEETLLEFKCLFCKHTFKCTIYENCPYCGSPQIYSDPGMKKALEKINRQRYERAKTQAEINNFLKNKLTEIQRKVRKGEK